MTPTIVHIICGPQGSGKTRSIDHLAQMFGADMVIDDWTGRRKDLASLLSSAVARDAATQHQTKCLIVLTSYPLEKMRRLLPVPMMQELTVSLHEFEELHVSIPEYQEMVANDETLSEVIRPGFWKEKPAADTLARPTNRDEAAALIGQLQEEFDLIDETTMLRDLVEKMEERHSEQFETFFEVVIARFLQASGLKEITLNTENLFAELVAPRRLILTAAPGTLTYRLPEENEDGKQE